MKQRERKQRRKKENFLARQRLLAQNYRKMTQEELLAEARETEKKNLRSLQRHERLEEDRRRTVVRHGLKGRVTRIQSTRMPLIEVFIYLRLFLFESFDRKWKKWKRKKKKTYGVGSITIDATQKKLLLTWGDTLVSLRSWRLQNSKNAGH